LELGIRGWTKFQPLASKLVRSGLAWLLSAGSCAFEDSYRAHRSESVRTVAASSCLFWWDAGMVDLAKHFDADELDKRDKGDCIGRMLLLLAAMYYQAPPMNLRDKIKLALDPVMIGQQQLLLNLFGHQAADTPE